MESFKYEKFFEINIVLSVAYLTNKNYEPILNDVYDRSKKIFLFSVMKCFMSAEMVMEIFENLSLKLQVDETEFKCIQQTTQYGSNENDYTTTPEGIERTMYSNEVYEERTTSITIEEHQLMNDKSEKRSMDSESTLKTPQKACDLVLGRLNKRIATFHYSSFSDEQKLCMFHKTTKNNLLSLYNFIITRKSRQANGMLYDVIAFTVWNYIECEDVFGLSDLLEDLLPLNEK